MEITLEEERYHTISLGFRRGTMMEMESLVKITHEMLNEKKRISFIISILFTILH